MSKLKFDPNLGVIVPTTREIREDIATKFKAIFQKTKKPDEPELNTDPTSPMGQVIDLIVAEIEAKNAEILFLANMMNPMTARGVFLDANNALYLIERKVSEPTLVTCQCRGVPGTLIPYGVFVKDSNGNMFRHNVVSGARIAEDGVVETSFECVKHGAIEVNKNTVNQIVTLVAGWESVDNEVAGVVGRDTEQDSEFRARYYDSVAINARGTVSALEAEVRNLEGVIHAVVLENIGNEPLQAYGVEVEPHSVAISVFGGNDTDIAKAIWRKKGAGCGTTGNHTVFFNDGDHLGARYEYKIFRPKATKVALKVSLYADSLDEKMKTAIKKAVVMDFNGQSENKRVGFAETVYASRFIPVITRVTRAPIKAVEISINSGKFDKRVQVNADQQPTLTVEDVTIEIAKE